MNDCSVYEFHNKKLGRLWAISAPSICRDTKMHGIPMRFDIVSKLKNKNHIEDIFVDRARAGNIMGIADVDVYKPNDVAIRYADSFLPVDACLKWVTTFGNQCVGLGHNILDGIVTTLRTRDTLFGCSVVDAVDFYQKYGATFERPYKSGQFIINDLKHRHINTEFRFDKGRSEMATEVWQNLGGGVIL